MSHRKLTVLAGEYLQNYRRTSWSTRQLTKRSFKLLIKAVGDIDLEYFTVEHAEIFQNWLLDRFARTTANIYLKTIRPAFRWAMRHHWIEKDVFAIPLSKPSRRKVRIYEPFEFKAMLDAIPKENKIMWCGRLLLGRTCGLRRSETLHLRRCDIDYDRRLIHIQSRKETSKYLAWEPKGRECRVLPMLDSLAEVLLEREKELPKEYPYLMITDIRYWRIQQMRKQGILPQRVRLCPDENFAIPFQKILRRARVAHGTFHDLRKTYLTEMAESGLPLHWLQKLAGHSDSQTTLNYYVTVRQQRMLTEARRLLGQLFGETGFEPATSRPPAGRSGQTELLPATISHRAF